MATDNPDTPGKSGEGSIVVHSLKETAELALRLLPLLESVPCVSLEGPLGAGKTHFVKSVASAMGIGEQVSSPTFTLFQTYRSGSAVLHHADWYRLESAEEVLSLGLEDYLGDGPVLIEWGDRFPEFLPPGTLRIGIRPLKEESRSFTWTIPCP